MISPVPSDDFQVYDTTLRDGSQGEGLSLSVAASWQALEDAYTAGLSRTGPR